MRVSKALAPVLTWMVMLGEEMLVLVPARVPVLELVLMLVLVLVPVPVPVVVRTWVAGSLSRRALWSRQSKPMTARTRAASRQYRSNLTRSRTTSKTTPPVATPKTTRTLLVQGSEPPRVWRQVLWAGWKCSDDKSQNRLPAMGE